MQLNRLIPKQFLIGTLLQRITLTFLGTGQVGEYFLESTSQHKWELADVLVS